MAAVIRDNEKEERRKVVEILENQIKIEGELVAQYKNYGEKLENVPVRQMLHMIMFDSQKHMVSLQAAIDIIEGRDVLREDRKDLKDGLKRHIELEMESIKAAEKTLQYVWVRNTPGLKFLLEAWRDEEKRHHRILKQLSERPFIKIDQLATAFKGEDFFEKRYLSSKRFLEKKSESNKKKDK
jgi:bacterioferritin (cytochrome b1)